MHGCETFCELIQCAYGCAFEARFWNRLWEKKRQSENTNAKLGHTSTHTNTLGEHSRWCFFRSPFRDEKSRNSNSSGTDCRENEGRKERNESKWNGQKWRRMREHFLQSVVTFCDVALFSGHACAITAVTATILFHTLPTCKMWCRKF